LTAIGEVEKASELLSLHWEELERIDWSTLDEPGTSPAEIGRFYAEVLTALGHLEEAEEVKLAIAAQEAEDPEAVLVWAKSLSKSNRLHHARELLERIVKGDPSNVDARRLLADALQAEAHWLQQESE
jgi:thioredoxin-like negative regulator of GroEL